ncbi:NAD(P)H-dependent oxidoreductase [Lacrimispora sp.]|uniref:NAD(P)H-dependent oxidoreductase n=1 Tax=Lacrimispora sp. TaxID=2719234 RepID=UPI0028A943E1|nr:NAD(P)H-dependent oxidoreductase [Lacrimispora sp.]
MATEQQRQEILQLHNRRYAAKTFDPERHIADEDLDTILEAGRLSPSSFGYEPWKFVVLKDETVRQKFKEIAPGAMNAIDGGAEIVLILYKKDITYNSPYVKHIVEDTLGLEFSPESQVSQIFKAFQEEMMVLSDEKAVNEWARHQVYIPLANMMITAAYLNIDSCGIEGMLFEPVENILSELGVMDRDEYGLACLLALGYRKEDIKPKFRRPFAEVVTFI